MPALRRSHWTVDEVDRLAEEQREPVPRLELVDGELLVTPAPTDRHQRIVGELFVLVREYVRQHRLGEARLGPGRARLTADSRFQPDIFVVPAADGRLPAADDSITSLHLVIEVLSPGSARHDRIIKRRFFQSHGVPAYWVVDGEAEVFEIWKPDDERAMLAAERLVWEPAGAPAPFVLDVERFFADLADGRSVAG